MDTSPQSHLQRRSRLRSFAGDLNHVDLTVRSSPNDSVPVPIKRAPQNDMNNPHVNHGQAAQVQSTQAAQAVTRTVGQAVGNPSTQRQAAQAATIGTTRTAVDPTPTTAAASSNKATLAPVASSFKKTIDFGTPSSSSTSTSPSPSPSPSSTSTSTSTLVRTTSSSSTSSTTTSSSSSTSDSVRLLTMTSTTTSATPTSTLDAAKSTSSSSGTSTGAVVGAVLGAVVGLVIIGSFFGWLYRKYTARSYNSSAPWARIDDDITPFPPSEKYTDDVYGGDAAPVIGSRRALAMARDNTGLRDSDMYDRGDNRAGVGAGPAVQPYDSYGSGMSQMYGFDPQGRPYPAQGGRTPLPHMYEAEYASDPYPRQLVGPGAHGNAGPYPPMHPYANADPYGAVPMPTPVPMGRPTAPSTAAEFALCEDFSDEPEPITSGIVYTMGSDQPRTPTGPMTRVEGRSRVSLTPQAPRVLSPTQAVQVHDHVPAPPLAVPQPAATATSAPIPLPHFAPLSPLMSDFDFTRRQSQPMSAMYEDDQAAQKRMYGEVANEAGIEEPVTPRTAMPSPIPADSVNRSGVSARMPEHNLPPQPYVHGQPLSPLNEVPTPMSGNDGLLNPFDLPSHRAPPPPFTAAASAAEISTSSFPSPAYPPPSPGGMSVPGSVTDSPRRWDEVGTPRGRAVSVNYDEEDAYGGI
ncbi:hypothetical protein IAU60_001365 [Kwoniella sp. DSM 27419]